MGIRKCIVPDCPSSTARPEDRGVTFHKIPFHEEMKRQWIVACQLPDDFRASKTTNVCSRHFRKSDFQEFKGKKYVLKFGVVPAVFPWTIASASKVQPQKSPVKNEEQGDDGEEFQHEVGDNEGETVPSDEVQPSIKQEKIESPAPKSLKANVRTNIKRARSSKKVFKTPSKQARMEPPSASPRKQTPKKAPSTPKSIPADVVADGAAGSGLEKGIDFTPGTKIEAQDFGGRWHPASLLEVDTEEREVLVQFDKAEKAKTNEEWIPMDSVRLRPLQSGIFAIGEKVFARWSDSRKFKATIKSILENDMYEVLFDDGLAKICRSTHISRIKRVEEVASSTAEEVVDPAKPNVQGVVVKTEAPDLSEAKDAPMPLVSLSQFCIPQVVTVSELPEIPKDGEWCCHWMNDYPVGEPSELDLPSGRVYTVIVADWRLPDGWVKHIFQRVTVYGKMDIVLVSPSGKMLRSKQEAKKYLEDIGETYDVNTYDFGLHRKRSKDLGFCHYTQEYRDSFLPKPSSEPVLLNTEVNIGSVKVKIIDNLFQCPEEDCLKTFRKENHLQIHIKHYHKELAKGLGEIPNMQDLAALRNPIDLIDAHPKPTSRRSNVGAAAKVKEDKKEAVHIKAEPDVEAPKESENLVDAPEHVKSPTEVKQEERKPVALAPVKSIEAEAEGPKAESGVAEETAVVASIPAVTAGSSSTSKPKAQSKVTKIKLFSQKKQKGSLSKVRRGFVTKSGGSAKKVKRMKASQRALANRSAPVLGPSDSFDGQPFAGFGDFDQDRPVGFYDDSSINASVAGGPAGLLDENGELIKIVRMRKEEIINCLCKVTEEDGLMVQCEMCLCWQHAFCQDIRSSSEVPETYVCSICRYPYRGRASKRYAHDQDWLYEGKLPVAKYHSSNSKHPQRFDILKNCHTLTGNLLELKRFMHSLQVKINIAENKDHPKMYLWSKKWEKSPPRGGATDPAAGAGERQSTGGERTAGQQPIPQIPVPEAPIDPAECQAILLDHIQKQQNDAMGRLQAIEAQIIGLEAYDDKADLLESPTAKNYPKTKQTIHMLLNDLLKMKKIGAIHSDFNNLAQEMKLPPQ
uniref:MBD domain-containing protein n=1 Tax=Anopheles atroparvus TaxID=41427 RepID=A0AAG5D9Y5_ANOAO